MQKLPDSNGNAPYEAIFNDVAEARCRVGTDDSQFNRRVLVRTAYSGIEALTNWMKALALKEHEAGFRRFSAAQVSILRDESFSLDSSGTPRSQPKFFPLDSNFRFAVDLFLHRPWKELPLEVDWGSTGWQCLKAGLKVRNRLTHPRCSADLSVSDEELRSVNVGYKFVVDLFIGHLIRTLEQQGKRSEPSA